MTLFIGAKEIVVYENDFSKSDLLENLNVLEVFAFLWLVSCRNAFSYDENLYVAMVNNKTIGNLLKRLSEIDA